MKEHIKAEISWATIVQGRFQARLQVNEKDVLQAMESSGTRRATRTARMRDDAAKAVGFEYTLRPILFVVGRGAGQDVIEARKKEAEALRARFESCETGIPIARALGTWRCDEPIVRSSADLQPAVREILDHVPVGHLTARR